MPKIIFLDLDGTLLYKKDGNLIVGDYTKKIIKQVQAQGNLVFVASGRPYAFIPKEVVELNLDGYVLANGATILYKNNYLTEYCFSLEYIQSFIQTCKENNIEYALETKKYTYIDSDSHHLINFLFSAAISPDYILEEDPVAYDSVIKLDIMPNDDAGIRVCENFISDEVNVFGTYPYTYEICQRKVTKAKGILEVLKLLNIDIKDSIAFGDGLNDIEMLETVGTGYAMGNAKDEVKKHASAVCDKAANEGVAQVLAGLL